MSSNTEFTVVRSNKSSKVVSTPCGFCRKNKQPDWATHSFEECDKVRCNFCKKNGHFVSGCEELRKKQERDRDREERQREREERNALREQRLAAMTCNFCKKNGHSIKFCEELQKKQKKEEDRQKKRDTDFPATLPVASATAVTNVVKGWATVTKASRTPKILEQIAKQEEEDRRRVARQKEKERVDYLARVEKRKKMEEDRKVAQAKADEEYIKDMRDRFGTLWFNWVDTIEGGIYDSRIASDLRCEYEEEQIRLEDKWDEDIRRIEKETQEKLDREEKEGEEMKRTLSPAAYIKWEMEKQEEQWEEEDRWMDDGFCRYTQADSYYLQNAPKEYIENYNRTGHRLDWNQKILENQKLVGKK
jgi:type II secretory pathway pseudopilin PulG